MINTCKARHPRCYIEALIPIAPMDHGIKIVGPISLRSSLVTVGDLSKISQNFPYLIYPLIRHNPGNHGV